MLVFGIISPYSTVFIPAVGLSASKKVQRTIEGFELARDMLARKEPQKLILLAPNEDIFNIPMYWLGQKLDEKIEKEQILVENQSLGFYYDLGKRYGEEIKQEPKKTAVIAIGNLSQTLLDQGPKGFDPAGPEIDQAIVEAVRSKDTEALLDLDRRKLLRAEENGLRQILFLFGVFADYDYETKVWSYEGPFGTGYLLATFEPKNNF